MGVRLWPTGWRCSCACHVDGDENCYGCCRGKCTDESNIWKEEKEPDAEAK